MNAADAIAEALPLDPLSTVWNESNGMLTSIKYDGRFATADAVLAALRAAAGGADRVVLCWDGDECTLRGLAEIGEAITYVEINTDRAALGVRRSGTRTAFVLTDVAVTSPEEDR